MWHLPLQHCKVHKCCGSHWPPEIFKWSVPCSAAKVISELRYCTCTEPACFHAKENRQGRVKLTQTHLDDILVRSEITICQLCQQRLFSSCIIAIIAAAAGAAHVAQLPQLCLH